MCQGDLDDLTDLDGAGEQILKLLKRREQRTGEAIG